MRVLDMLARRGDHHHVEKRRAQSSTGEWGGNTSCLSPAGVHPGGFIGESLGREKIHGGAHSITKRYNGYVAKSSGTPWRCRVLRFVRLPKRDVKLLLFSAVIGGVVLSLTSCYVTTQGYHLLAQQIAAEPIHRLDRNELSEAERTLLDRVAPVRRFAAQRLHLDADDAYTTLYRTERDYLVDVVSAAREFSFERKEWWFPFFGSFPYKGFYRRDAAERLARRLDRNGWDVIIRPVEAFSTLGFFQDPLVSFMAGYDEARLAELVIHETAHATLWVRGEAQFNEEFATFVGQTGARAYLIDRYGPDDDRIAQLEARRADGERFRADVLSLKGELADLYRHRDRLSDAETRAAKRAVIAAYQRSFADRYDEHYATDRFLFFSETDVNNAYLDLFETYTGNLDRFQEFHDRIADGDLPETIAAIICRVEAWEATPTRSRGPIISILEEP